MCIICKAPFFTAEIFENGDVYLCCPGYTKLDSIGNIYKQNWDEIWNSESAQKLRKKVKQGDFSSCNTNFCSPDFFPFCREVNYVSPESLDYENPKVKILKLSMDRSCNVACTICRNEVYCNEKERIDFLNSKIEDVFLPLLKDVEIVNFTGVGDPFASRHVRTFVKRIVEKYPNMRFDFHSNGVLCDEKMLSELGVIDKLSTIQISLHSASKETYDKIVKYGNWERLNNNLEFLSGLIEKGKLNELQLNFVIFSENYKDIPDFIELCKKYNAQAYFWQYRDFTRSVYDFDSVNIFSPLHRDHKNLIKLLTNLDLSNQNLHVSPLLKQYIQIKNIEEYYMYANIFANQMLERYETDNSIFLSADSKLEKRIRKIERILENQSKKLSLIQKIFSITNEKNGKKKHKVITLLGMKFKIKRK